MEIRSMTATPVRDIIDPAMTPADARRLIKLCGQTNAEMAAALGIRSDVMVRRMMSGREPVWPETAQRIVDLAADTLSAQMLRAIEAIAGGPIRAGSLTIHAAAVELGNADARLSADIAAALRQAVLARLGHAGITVVRA